MEKLPYETVELNNVGYAREADVSEQLSSGKN